MSPIVIVFGLCLALLGTTTFCQPTPPGSASLCDPNTQLCSFNCDVASIALLDPHDRQASCSPVSMAWATRVTTMLGVAPIVPPASPYATMSCDASSSGSGSADVTCADVRIEGSDGTTLSQLIPCGECVKDVAGGGSGYMFVTCVGAATANASSTSGKNATAQSSQAAIVHCADAACSTCSPRATVLRVRAWVTDDGAAAAPRYFFNAVTPCSSAAVLLYADRVACLGGINAVARIGSLATDVCDSSRGVLLSCPLRSAGAPATYYSFVLSEYSCAGGTDAASTSAVLQQCGMTDCYLDSSCFVGEAAVFTTLPGVKQYVEDRAVLGQNGVWAAMCGPPLNGTCISLAAVSVAGMPIPDGANPIAVARSSLRNVTLVSTIVCNVSYQFGAPQGVERIVRIICTPHAASGATLVVADCSRSTAAAGTGWTCVNTTIDTASELTEVTAWPWQSQTAAGSGAGLAAVIDVAALLPQPSSATAPPLFNPSGPTVIAFATQLASWNPATPGAATPPFSPCAYSLIVEADGATATAAVTAAAAVPLGSCVGAGHRVYECDVLGPSKSGGSTPPPPSSAIPAPPLTAIVRRCVFRANGTAAVANTCPASAGEPCVNGLETAATLPSGSCVDRGLASALTTELTCSKPNSAIPPPCAAVTMAASCSHTATAPPATSMRQQVPMVCGSCDRRDGGPYSKLHCDGTYSVGTSWFATFMWNCDELCSNCMGAATVTIRSPGGGSGADPPPQCVAVFDSGAFITDAMQLPCSHTLQVRQFRSTASNSPANCSTRDNLTLTSDFGVPGGSCLDGVALVDCQELAQTSSPAPPTDAGVSSKLKVFVMLFLFATLCAVCAFVYTIYLRHRVASGAYRQELLDMGDDITVSQQQHATPSRPSHSVRHTSGAAADDHELNSDAGSDASVDV